MKNLNHPICSSVGRRGLAGLAGILLAFSSFAADGQAGASGDSPAVTGLTYLNNVTFPTGLRYEGWTTGGLSGIDWNPVSKEFVTTRDNTRPGLGPDGAGQTSLFTLIPEFTPGQPGYSVKFTGVTPMNNPDWQPETNGLEAVQYDPDGDGLWLSSESENVLYHLHRDGKTRETITLPEIVTGGAGNTQLEGMAFTPGGELWVIREAPRAEDNGIIRISHLKKDGQVIAQYPYRMDDLLNNGVSELLATTEDSFLVMERGWDGKSPDTEPTGESHNSVRVYRVDLSAATDISGNKALAANSTTPVEKTLVFDSKDVAGVLNTWDTKIDNLEGMSFGPTLLDGKKSLIMVSDDNFLAKQRKTQFIIFRVEQGNAE